MPLVSRTIVRTTYRHSIALSRAPWYLHPFGEEAAPIRLEHILC